MKILEGWIGKEYCRVYRFTNGYGLIAKEWDRKTGPGLWEVKAVRFDGPRFETADPVKIPPYLLPWSAVMVLLKQIEEVNPMSDKERIKELERENERLKEENEQLRREKEELERGIEEIIRRYK